MAVPVAVLLATLALTAPVTRSTREHATAGGYNPCCEQPRFLLDQIGTRESVVHNPLDQQVMLSHASWVLLLTRERLVANQGWHSAHDGPGAHWKHFWFDRQAKCRALPALPLRRTRPQVS